jgi:hypothetical protein
MLAISIQKPFSSLKTKGGNSFIAMFISEPVSADNKPGKASKWKIKQINSVVFFFILLRYRPLTLGFGGLMDNGVVGLFINRKNNSAPFGSEMIGNGKFSVKRKSIIIGN